MAVVVGAGDLETNSPATVGDREQVIDRVQFAAGLVRVVDTGDAGSHLEAQQGVVTQCASDAHEVLAGDEHGHLAAVDHDPLDGVGV